MSLQKKRISEKDEWDYTTSLSISRTEPWGTESLNSDTGLRLTLTTENENTVSLLYRNTISRTETLLADEQITANRYAIAVPVTLLPFVVKTSFAYQNTVTERSEAGFLEPVSDLYTLGLSADPRPTMSHTLSISRSQDSLGGELLTTNDSVSLTNSLGLYKGLDSSLGLTAGSITDHQRDAEIRSSGFNLGLNAILTERLTGRSSYQRTRQEGTPDVEVMGLSLSYKLSPLFKANGSLDSSHSGDSSVLAQSYNLAWAFSERLSTRFAYAHSQSESAGGTFKSSVFRSGVSWRVNNSVNLTLDYDQSETDVTAVKRIFLSMNATI